MTLHIYDQVEQRSPEWYALRCGIVTASAVGKLLTPTLKVADNDTARGLIATLAAERICGWTEDTPMSGDMWRGVEMEPYARDLYSEHYARAAEVGFMVLEEGPWSLGYSPDGLVGDDGLIEIKCPRAKTHMRTILEDEVPPYYMAQLQAGLLVSGRDWIDYVSYCGGMPLYVKRVEPSPMTWQPAVVMAASEAEQRIRALVADYVARIDGLPTTERIDPNRVELKL